MSEENHKIAQRDDIAELERQDRARIYAARNQRPSWDEYFLRMAETVATRSTCPKRKVGAVIVDAERIVVATGYNGSPSGLPHCTTDGCIIEAGKCVRTIHAEVNALVHGEPRGMRGGTAYCTTLPCWSCFKALLGAGISRVVYVDEGTPDDLISQFAALSGVKLARCDLKK